MNKIFSITRICVLLFFALSFGNVLQAQNSLNIQSASVDSLLKWMNSGRKAEQIPLFADLPANQLMEQLLKENDKVGLSFKEALQKFSANDSVSGNLYLLNDAYAKRAAIADLLPAIKNNEFSSSLYRRVLIYFPPKYVPTREYNVFLSATGWQWGDAMTFGYKTSGDKWKLTDKGTPAIIFNLTLVSKLYGKTTTERLEVLKNVMSHELFHAIFADYAKANHHYKKQKDITSEAFHIMLDEGMAHYISDWHMVWDNYSKGDKLKTKEKEAFSQLSDSAKVIFNTTLPDSVRRNAMQSGTFGPYWKKYMTSNTIQFVEQPCSHYCHLS